MDIWEANSMAMAYTPRRELAPGARRRGLAELRQGHGLGEAILYCPDPASCTTNCARDAVTSAEYENTYCIAAISKGIRLKFVSQGAGGANYGSGIYLPEDMQKYSMLHVKNKDFTFTVGMSRSCRGPGASALGRPPRGRPQGAPARPARHPRRWGRKTG